MPDIARSRKKPIRGVSVAVDRLRVWHRPGLLCIGDAVHAMSTIGGVGDQFSSLGCGRRRQNPGATSARFRSKTCLPCSGAARACRQLSQIVAAARWMAARKFLAVLS
jgi:hypothetical protein